MTVDNVLVPLLIMKASGGRITGRTRFQKLTFLHQAAQATDRPFHFVAWDFGPYSKDLQEYIDALVELNWIDEVPMKLDGQRTVYEYRMTDKGRKIADQSLANRETREEYEALVKLVSPWHRRPLDDLIRHVYSSYPDYTVRSKLLH